MPAGCEDENLWKTEIATSFQSNNNNGGGGCRGRLRGVGNLKLEKSFCLSEQTHKAQCDSFQMCWQRWEKRSEEATCCWVKNRATIMSTQTSESVISSVWIFYLFIYFWNWNNGCTLSFKLSFNTDKWKSKQAIHRPGMQWKIKQPLRLGTETFSKSRYKARCWGVNSSNHPSSATPVLLIKSVTTVNSDRDDTEECVNKENKLSKNRTLKGS